MTYYPYFRGKQFELLAIRDTVDLMADAEFVPIIEPVRSSLTSLRRALDAIVGAGGECVVIVNPQHGDHSSGSSDVEEMLEEHYSDVENVAVGILLRGESPDDEVTRLIESYGERAGTTLIHAGFTNDAVIATAIADLDESPRHVFLEAHTSTGYRNRRFTAGTRVLIQDGFTRTKNADYPSSERFSDLHLEYADHHRMNGYGDFLTVGDNYSESGGPAYAVAIHLTYLDADQFDEMFVRHFVSTTNDTPTDPAGKFKEALDELIAYADSENSMLEPTAALQEFRELHTRQHFPGLGSVKKLSMKHHLETLQAFHARP